MVRSATMRDADSICTLINYYAERGRMLHRSLENVYESLRDFIVFERDGAVRGCVAISVSGKDLGEVRSLAVSADSQGQGLGRQLMDYAVEQARRIGLNRVFALTYEPEFFAKLGFRTVDRETLPTKVWRDCIHCPRADACDEVAMVLDLA